MTILLSSLQLLKVAFYLTYLVSAAAADYCDRSIYGQPLYYACVTLLYGDPRRHTTGIYKIDGDDHGFLLPYFAGSGAFTIEQWRHRVTLPELWSNGTSSSRHSAH